VDIDCRLKAEEYAHDAKLKAESLEAKAKGISFPPIMLILASAGSSPFGTIELYSPKYYLACTLGGIVACGLTHAAVTPLDLVPLQPPSQSNRTNARR
jgi:hypothetical protein